MWSSVRTSASPPVIDLYLTNLKTGKLRIFKGVGRMLNSEGDAEYVQAPSISHDGSVILIPGRLDSYGIGDHVGSWTGPVRPQPARGHRWRGQRHNP